MIAIRGVRVDDAPAITAIYNPYVLDTIVTFEEEAVTAVEMARRIADVQTSNLPWIVAEDAGALVGYAYATKWRPRHAYRFSTEVTVYVTSGLSGQGIGSRLYQHLLPLLRQHGVHAAMGGIALPNGPSIRLHEKSGFRKVAHFEQAGFKFGRWIDVGYWQIVF